MPYFHDPGEINGDATLEAHFNMPAIELCAQLCDTTPNCCSFEYGMENKNCDLNVECRPDAPVKTNINFCTKGTIHFDNQ